jgi:uncharacterized protein
MKQTPIVTIFAALLALLFVALSVQTIRARRSLKIGLGDGNNPQMIRAMRVHANFAEYVPFALLLLFLCEFNGAQQWFVFAVGSALLLGRCLHAYGVNQIKENFRFRVSGMAMTITSILVCALYLLVLVFRS